MIKEHKIKKEFCASVLSKRRISKEDSSIEKLLPFLKSKRKLFKNIHGFAVEKND